MTGESATLPSSRPVVSIFRARRWAVRATGFAIALGLGVLFMIPFFWTVSSSLKAVHEIHVFPPTWLPAAPQWHNYALVFEFAPYGRWLMNTVHITSLALIGTISSASLVAYSFARFRYVGRDLLFMVTLSTMMLPIEVTIIPQYLMFNRLGWLDTYKPLIVPSFFGGGAFNIFLLRQFFMTIPRDLDEAALIDGAGTFRILWEILVPLSKPAFATAAVITFIGQWNLFLPPLIFLSSELKYPVSVGLRFFQVNALIGGEPRDHLLMAAAVIMLTPCITLFFVAQRYFVQGVVMSGIKG